MARKSLRAGSKAGVWALAIRCGRNLKRLETQSEGTMEGASRGRAYVSG